MLLAILLVLILIAVILAPWLLGVIAALATAYGVVVVSLLVLGVVLVPILFSVLWMLRYRSGHRTPEQRMTARAVEFNRQYVQEAEEKQRKGNFQSPKVVLIPEVAEATMPTVDGVKCVRCSKEYPLLALVCPACGKSNPKT